MFVWGDPGTKALSDEGERMAWSAQISFLEEEMASAVEAVTGVVHEDTVAARSPFHQPPPPPPPPTAAVPLPVRRRSRSAVGDPIALRSYPRPPGRQTARPPPATDHRRHTRPEPHTPADDAPPRPVRRVRFAPRSAFRGAAC